MGINDIIYGIIFTPKETFAGLCSDRKKTGWAIAFFLIIMLVQSITGHALAAQNGALLFAWPKIILGFYWSGKLIACLLTLFLMIGFISLLADLFYRKKDTVGLLITFCFAALPGALGAGLQLAMAFIGLNRLGVCFAIFTFLWILALQVISIKTVLEIKTEQALALLLSPVIIVVLSVIIVVMSGTFLGSLF
ncbi:MAG: YIP1 family protein [Syntrophomonadaceae bacterium]|jgi:hypothetical protein|nr:YIP1 family protein [Syntrophomonadaceae bacterium]